MGFPRQEYWSGLPFPSPGDIPGPENRIWVSFLAGGFFTTESPGKPWWLYKFLKYNNDFILFAYSGSFCFFRSQGPSGKRGYLWACGGGRSPRSLQPLGEPLLGVLKQKTARSTLYSWDHGWGAGGACVEGPQGRETGQKVGGDAGLQRAEVEGRKVGCGWQDAWGAWGQVLWSGPRVTP